jgi:hypothetical protein
MKLPRDDALLKDEMVMKLAKLYEHLCDIADNFILFFIFRMICDVSLILFYNILCYFGIYRFLVRNMAEEYIGISIFTLASNNFFTVVVSAAVGFCSLLTKEGRNTVVLLHKNLHVINDGVTKKRVDYHYFLL